MKKIENKKCFIYIEHAIKYIESVFIKQHSSVTKLSNRINLVLLPYTLTENQQFLFKPYKYFGFLRHAYRFYFI